MSAYERNVARDGEHAALWRASHQSSAEGVVLVSAAGELVSVNPQFLRLWNLPSQFADLRTDEAALALAAQALVDPDGFLERVAEVYAARERSQDELRLLDGRVLHRYGEPLHADGRYLGYAWYFRDVTPARAAADLLEASESRYRALVAALSNGVWYADADGRLRGDMPAWRAVTGQTAAEVLGLGWLAGVHAGDRERVAASWRQRVGNPAPFIERYRICPPGVTADDDERIRTLETRGVPMRRHGTVVEWVGVFTDVTELAAAERAREHLAALVAEAARRTGALQAVTAALSRAVTTADVMDVILEHGEHQIGASASGIALREGDHVHYQLLKGYSSDVQAQWRYFDLDVESPVPYVLRTGEPLFLSDRVAILARFPALQAFLEASGEHALARLPLVTPTGVLGVLTLGFGQPHAFSVEDRTFLMALAGQCAQALERTQLYEHARDTALVLQRSLLPETLPSTPGLALAARYLPGTADVEVGGDWYDALHLPDGRLAVVVGDVLGKGVRAASVMGQVRNALRGLLHADPAPPVVMDRLDALVRQLGGDEEFVTLVYAVVDPVDGVVEWASAGHPPPLLVRAGRGAYLGELGTLPLGLGPDPAPVSRLQLQPGDLLLLFSDGLVESRRRALDAGLAALCQAVSDARVGAEALPALCDTVLKAMTGSRQDDDVTMLVVARNEDGHVETPEVAETVLPAHAASVSQGRRFVSKELAGWGLDSDRVETAMLCASELITNAVVHAGTDVTVRAERLGGRVRVSVRDGRRANVVATPEQAGPEATHGRGLYLVQSMSSDWGIEDEAAGKLVWFDLEV